MARAEHDTKPGRWIYAVVAILTALHLAPVWAFDFFPSQDGPAHVHNAAVILEYRHPDRTVYRDYYELNLQPVPNLLGHLALAAAMTVAPPRVAEKILVSAILLLTLGAMLYLFHVLRPGPSFAWLLPFPLLFHYPLHMGFYNFSLGLPIALFAIGCVLSARGRFGPGRTVLLTGLLLVLYLAHIVAWVFALIACTILVVGVGGRPRGLPERREVPAGSRGSPAGAPSGAPGPRPAPAGTPPDPASARLLPEPADLDPPSGHASGVVASFAASGTLVAWYFLRDDPRAWTTASALLLAGAAGAMAGTATPVIARLHAHRLMPGRVPLRALRRVRRIASPPTRHHARRLAPLALASALPAAIALALTRSGTDVLGPVTPGPSTTTRLRTLWGVDALMSYSPLENPPAVAAAVLLATLAVLVLARSLVVRSRRHEPGHPARGALGWVALAFCALYLTAPDGVAGGAYVLPRIALFALLATTLWVGAHRFHPILERSFGMAAAAIAVVFLAVRLPVYRDLDRQLRDVHAAARPITPSTTLLALSYSPFGTTGSGGLSSYRVKPLMHAAGRIAAEKKLVLLNNYEAMHRDFPVRYRPTLDPTPHFPGVLYPARFRVDLEVYPRRTGGHIDYVLTWGFPTRTDPGTAAHHTRVQLETGFEAFPAPASSAARLYVKRR